MNLKLFLTLALLLHCLAGTAQLGLGTRISLLNPKGDLGPSYKKALCYEIIVIGNDSPEEWIRQRMGLVYTSLQPRLDSFPSWMHQGGNDPVFFPGNTSLGNLTMVMIYGGFDVKTLQLGGFTWYVGTNLVFGYAMGKYSRSYETLLSEVGVIDQMIGGLMFRTAFDFRLVKHLSLSAEFSKSSIVAPKWTPSYGHYNYGIGITYHFNPDE